MLNFEKMGSPVYTNTASPLAQLLMEEYPEVINAVRLDKEPGLIQYNQKRFNEEKFFYAEPSFLEIFSFPIVKGNPETALKDPFTVLITEEMSMKYFGTDDPINKTLRYCRGGEENDFKITGVLKNVPQNSHIRFDFLASFKTLYSTTDINWDSWMPPQCKIYIRLQEGVNPFELEKKLEDFVVEKTRGWYKVLLQPIKNIHLHSHVNQEFEENGSIVYIYLFSTIGFFIIFIACINYMNITTARSTTRSKEIGLRKTIGATRRLLIRQFLAESILWAFTAFGISMLLVVGIHYPYWV
jgi:putative ABC transport system permease protein